VRPFFAVIKMLREGFGTVPSLGFCCRCASRHGLVPKGNSFRLSFRFADYPGVYTIFVNISAFSGTDSHNLLDPCRDSAT
jgi:hypothetical protein